MPRNIDVALLRAFDAVVETGGLTKAARLLNVTQAAVSLQLKRLEETFGRRLLAQARRVLRHHDEMWASMTAPDFAGEVRLGMPSDLVRPYGTPVLRRFDQAWPRVRVSVICDTSGRLLEKLDRGDVDLTMTVQTSCGPHGESLLADPLVWVGARNGTAFERKPLPISTGDETCPHRPVALKALAEAGRDWRFICESSSFEPICATVEADIAVSPMLASTIPDALQMVDEKAGLPRLQTFLINLYLPRAAASDLALELAGHIRSLFARRARQVA